MAETALVATYDGPALADGRMRVRELAPALLALGDLFTEASSVAYPDREPVALDIKATEDGSFILHLILQAESAWDQVSDLFTSESISALVNLKELVLAPTVGLLALIKRSHGKRIRSRENALPGRIKLTFEDGEALEVPSEVVRLYDRPTVRRSARAVVAPLAREGVSALYFQSEEQRGVSIEEDDLPAFEADFDDDIISENEVEMVVSIIAPVFVQGNKWRLSTGGNASFFASIEDLGFLERVEQGESFAKGDSLLCMMLITQSRRDGALQSDYRVVKVLRHFPRGEQLRLTDDS